MIFNCEGFPRDVLFYLILFFRPWLRTMPALASRKSEGLVIGSHLATWLKSSSNLLTWGQREVTPTVRQVRRKRIRQLWITWDFQPDGLRIQHYVMCFFTAKSSLWWQISRQDAHGWIEIVNVWVHVAIFSILAVNERSLNSSSVCCVAETWQSMLRPYWTIKRGLANLGETCFGWCFPALPIAQRRGMNQLSSQSKDLLIIFDCWTNWTNETSHSNYTVMTVPHPLPPPLFQHNSSLVQLYIMICAPQVAWKLAYWAISTKQVRGNGNLTGLPPHWGTVYQWSTHVLSATNFFQLQQKDELALFLQSQLFPTNVMFPAWSLMS